MTSHQTRYTSYLLNIIIEKWQNPISFPPSNERSDGGTYISTFFTINEWSKQTKNLKDKVFGIHLPAFHA